MKNYYEILEISTDASKEEIEKAAIKKLRLWSHRANAPLLERRQEAERMIALLEEIQETLLDPHKREQYDQSIGVSSQKTSDEFVENKSTTLPSAVPNQGTIPKEVNQSETQPELPQATEPRNEDIKQEKLPFTTDPIKVETKPEESPSSTDPTHSSSPPETPQAPEITKSEPETKTTPKPIPDQRESEKAEETELSNGKVRIRKGWFWGIGLILVVSVGLIVYTLLFNTPTLVVGQEMNIKNGFIFTVDSFTEENGSTHLQVSIKPEDNNMEKYRNTYKQIESIREMLDKGEIGNEEQVRQVIDDPLIEMTVRFEDANRESLGTLKTSDAQRITDQTSANEIVETFKWSMNVFPKSTKYIVIESVQGVESDRETNEGNKMFYAERKTYSINQRFVLPAVREM